MTKPIHIASSVFLLTSSLMAKRAAPNKVSAITTEKAVFSVPHFSNEERHQNGGFVEAHHPKTKKLLWRIKIYNTNYNPDLEQDIQDVFIKTMSFEKKHNLLIFSDEKSRTFALNLDSKKVKQLEKSQVNEATKVWTKEHNKWPLDREWKVPANQKLEIFRNEYKVSALTGFVYRPNLYDWNYDGAYFKCGIEYKVELRYKGTQSGKDYYDLKITYPQNKTVRTISKKLIYEGSGIEIFRDDEYCIYIRPYPAN